MRQITIFILRDWHGLKEWVENKFRMKTVRTMSFSDQQCFHRFVYDPSWDFSVKVNTVVSLRLTAVLLNTRRMQEEALAWGSTVNKIQKYIVCIPPCITLWGRKKTKKAHCKHCVLCVWMTEREINIPAQTLLSSGNVWLPTAWRHP